MTTNYQYPLIGMMNRGLDGSAVRIQAGKAFYRALGRGRLAEFAAKVLGRQTHLDILVSQPVTTKRSAGHIISVPISQIKGSLSRSGDFDAQFNPLRERDRSRWINVATAFMQNIPLPPVDLVRVGEAYYVRDGHHRISVAKAMDQEIIDARIVN